jgi:hypothetical protein
MAKDYLDFINRRIEKGRSKLGGLFNSRNPHNENDGIENEIKEVHNANTRIYKEYNNRYYGDEKQQQIFVKDIEKYINECIELDYEWRKSSINRDYEDSIFRAYYSEGGIKYRFETVLDFIYNKMDDIDDTETLVIALYNSNFQLLLIQYNKLKNNLMESKENLEKLERISRSEILKMANWDFIDQKLHSYNEEIKELHSKINTIDKNHIRRRLNFINSELEVVSRSIDNNGDKLKSLLTSMRNNVVNKSENYGYILETLSEFLSKGDIISDIDNTYNYDAVTYKEHMKLYAEQIESVMLKIEKERSELIK